MSVLAALRSDASSTLQTRSIYTSPPQAQTAQDMRPTLLVSWWCTGFALAIILVRLIGRYIRSERLFREDKIMALGIIPLLLRMGLVHVILIWGTNNVVMPLNATATELRHRAIASRLVLASRIMYALFLWIAKLTICEFLKRLTSQAWTRTYEVGVQIIRYFLLITFIGVFIATLSECQPFNLYWETMPEPRPQCREGAAQLLTMGVSDIVTDLFLVIFPIPIVIMSNMPLKRKVSLVPLFALSLILVAITSYRVVAVIDRQYSQQFRSLLASLEILAEAAVANAIILGSFIRDRGTKKQRWRHAGGGASIGQASQIDRQSQTPRRTITNRQWGSDADLVGDLGIKCDAELSDQVAPMPRPAPTVSSFSMDPHTSGDLEASAHHHEDLCSSPSSLGYSPKMSRSTKDGRSKYRRHQGHRPAHSTSFDARSSSTSSPYPSRFQRALNSPASPNFFDVGGLLASSKTSPQVQPHARPSERACVPPSLAPSASISSRTGELVTNFSFPRPSIPAEVASSTKSNSSHRAPQSAMRSPSVRTGSAPSTSSRGPSPGTHTPGNNYRRHTPSPARSNLYSQQCDQQTVAGSPQDRTTTADANVHIPTRTHWNSAHGPEPPPKDF